MWVKVRRRGGVPVPGASRFPILRDRWWQPDIVVRVYDLAEEVGFEPTWGGMPPTDFESLKEQSLRFPQLFIEFQIYMIFR